MRKLLGFALLAFSVGAQAQGYPNRAVRVIVAAQTGGPDLVARIVAAELQQQTGQAFVVENQGGANGIVGATTVAKAAPDGYTLLVYSSGFVINPFVHKSLPYDTEKDFTPVTNLVTNRGLFFAVANSVPARSMQEFINHAKTPGVNIAYSTPGVGNTWHLAMEVLNSVTGLKMTHVPYKGGGPAVAALSAGEVQAILASPPPLMSHYKAGKVRVLAFSGDKRHPQLPEVPTMKELGIRYFHDGGWFGMFAPSGTPADTVDKLWREVRTALQKPTVRERLEKLGAEPVGDSPADYRKFIQAELKAYAEQARVAGIKPE